MKLSKRANYALLALIELALHQSNEPLQAYQIAERQNIPVSYLEQILPQLKNKGLVRSKNGFYGGFTLAQIPKDITLADVINSVETAVPTDIVSNIKRQTSESITVVHLWTELSQEVQDSLLTYTLQNFCERVKQKLPEAYMYHI